MPCNGVLRGPPWPSVDNKGVLPRPSRIDQMPCNGVLRGPPWPSVDNKGVLPRPSMNRPNYALAMVFSVALRGPPWTIKVFSPALHEQTKLCPCKGFLRGPSLPFVDKKVFSPALREQTKLCPCKSQFRQTSTSPSNPAGTRQFTIHYPLSPAVPPTPCSSPYPLPQDKGRFLRRTGGCGTVQPVWAVIPRVRVTRQIPPPRTT